MAKPTLKHLLPDGNVDKRQSARAYTHVVIGIFDVDAYVALAEQSAPQHSENFDYWTEQSGPRATVYGFSGGKTLAEENERARAELAGRTREQYVADCIAHDKAVRSKRFRGYQVLQWSQSLANAQKGLSNSRLTWLCHSLAVEEVNNGVRP